MFNKDGRPSGIADVSFDTEQMARRAMQKNKDNMQNRYIELFYEQWMTDLFKVCHEQKFVNDTKCMLNVEKFSTIKYSFAATCFSIAQCWTQNVELWEHLWKGWRRLTRPGQARPCVSPPRQAISAWRWRPALSLSKLIRSVTQRKLLNLFPFVYL